MGQLEPGCGSAGWKPDRYCSSDSLPDEPKKSHNYSLGKYWQGTGEEVDYVGS